jgi:arylsulfatase A-like enzyme
MPERAVRYREAPMSTVRRILSQRWPWLTMAVLVVLAYAATVVEIRIAPDDPRPVGTVADIEALRSRDDVNVVFVLIDTLRADHLHAWGHRRETSPFLDRLAASGVRFAHHVSQSSWTKCSMASLWTGLYPARTGVTRFDHVVSDEARLPAEILRDAGFRTAGLFRNGWVESYFGFDQGFEVYAKPVGRPAPASVRRENPTLKEVGTDVDAVDGAVEFLRVYGRERFFLYLHLMDLHEYLYDEDSARFGTSYEDVYDNSILRVNFVLQRLHDALAEMGHLDDTLVVIASDHGEAFSERGYEGHARFVYRETTQVPLIMSFPFRLEPGIVVESVTRNIDIWPTILDLLGLPAMEDVDGVSQRPAILAAAQGREVPRPESTAYAHLDRTWGQRTMEPSPTVSVVDGRYRYVRTPQRGGDTTEELFDLEEDVVELTDVSAEHPDVVARLRERVDGYLAGEPPWEGGAPSLEIDEMQLQQLRALGYKVP